MNSYLTQKKTGVTLSIHFKHAKDPHLRPNLERAVRYFLDQDLEVHDLYLGKIITLENLDELKDSIFA